MIGIRDRRRVALPGQPPFQTPDGHLWRVREVMLKGLFLLSSIVALRDKIKLRHWLQKGLGSGRILVLDHTLPFPGIENTDYFYWQSNSEPKLISFLLRELSEYFWKRSQTKSDIRARNMLH